MMNLGTTLITKFFVVYYLGTRRNMDCGQTPNNLGLVQCTLNSMNLDWNHYGKEDLMLRSFRM